MAKQPSPRLTRYLLILILLLAFALRFYALDAQSLWNDEGSSVALAGRDLATITRDAANDIHPPLYYWLLAGWTHLAGTGEVAIRSLSALLGVLLVALTYPLGRFLAGRWVGLAAALLAAGNPFQVYYSQEARMYILLAVWSALASYAAVRWAPRPSSGYAASPSPRWSVAYVLAATAGLYTHYAFPLVLLAINLVVLPWLAVTGWRQERTHRLRDSQPEPSGQRGPVKEGENPPPRTRREAAKGLWYGPLLVWLALQALVGLLFLPWLPAAYRQLTTWPRVAAAVEPFQALAEIARLFTTGPAASPWPTAGSFLLLLLLIFLPGGDARGGRAGRLPRPVAYLAPVAWLVVPVALILGLGLYKEAYAKFLIVASPAFCLLAGRAATAALRQKRGVRWLVQGLLGASLAALLVGASLHGLGDYYADPAYARDDYRAIAAYIEATGRPGDAVLLNAPGQQDVFGYYYTGELPVYPLPQERPLDPAATRQALEELTQPGRRVFAVLWATDESDPERFVEGWLDAQTYKALDSWYGNVRLAIYAVPDRAPDAPDRTLDVPLQDPETGDEIVLQGYSLLDDELAAGDIVQITFFWQVNQTPGTRYKVFVHLLDEANNVIGQRDAEPGGGAHLTTLWQPGEIFADNYGVPIHPATPPGTYRIEAGMYDPESGQRLLTPGGEGQVWLDPLTVARPQTAAPVAALDMQHAAPAQFGELHLLGYDLHRLGFAHQPEVPLHAGEALHLNLFWRAETQPTGDWQVEITLQDTQGKAWVGLEAEPVPAYPTNRWMAGDVWRGQFNLPLPSDLPPGEYRLQIQAIGPSGAGSEPFLAEPVTVAH